MDKGGFSVNGNQVVLGLVGSPNKAGRTNELVSAALEGASHAGAATELVQMSDCVVNACKDCLPWICNTKQKCTYEDKNFELLSKKMLGCGALVIGTPVYWGDTTGMVRYLFLKMYRVFAGSGQLKGLPSLGIAIAGGSGNGLTTGLRPIYHFFRTMQMRAIEPSRAPFKSSEECWLSYGAMPYIGENRAAERRLLAAVVFEAVSKGRRQEVEGDLAQADILAAAGQSLEAMNEVSKVYNSCIKVIGSK
jgi:multimeric flavodoxin WrbA